MIAEPLSRVLEATGYLSNGKPAAPSVTFADTGEVGGSLRTGIRLPSFEPEAWWRSNAELPPWGGSASDLTVYFKYVDNADQAPVSEWQREIWNRGFSPLLWIVSPDRIDLYNGFGLPGKSGDAVENRLDTFHLLDTRLAELDGLAGRLAMETGQFWRREKRVSRKTSVDSRLLRDIRGLERRLVESDLDREEAQGLIGRSIFSKYLIDRQIVTGQRLMALCGHDGLSEVLRDPTATERLFEWLRETFNGDMFTPTLMSVPGEAHLDRVARFLDGEDQETGQMSLFPYQFDFIPVELISAIYEQFVHSADSESDDRARTNAQKEGVYYTPLAAVSLVLDEIFDELTGNEHVLDLTCGSGVFLVEALRRLVYIKSNGRPPGRETIRKTLYEQVYGVDKSKAAVRIAAFSLYLAALELDPDPQPPEALRFEPLEGRTLLVGDAREIERTHTGQKVLVTETGLKKFDIIVGNPPWTYRGKEGTAKRQTSNIRRTRQPRGESLDFVTRATDFAHDKTRFGMILSATPFFSVKGVKAARILIESLSPVTLVNLSDLSGWLFSNANMPAVVLLARHREQRADQMTLVQTSWSLAGEQSHAFEITPSDVTTLPIASWKRNQGLFKAAFLGGQHDLLLLDALWEKCESLKTRLSFMSTKLNSGLKFGNRSHDATFLKGLPFAKRGISHFSVPDDLPAFDGDAAEKPRMRKIYNAPLLLVKEFILQRQPRPITAIAERDIVYSDNYTGVSFSDINPEVAYLVAGILGSALASWYYLMTGAEFGLMKRRLLLADVETTPMPDLEKAVESHAGKQVAQLTHTFHREAPDDEGWKSLDDAVFDLYELGEVDRIVVRDGLFRASWQWRRGRNESAESADGHHLSDYARAFVSSVDAWLYAANERRLRAEIYAPTSSDPLRAIRFVLEDNPPPSTIEIVRPDGSLREALAQIGMRLKVPLTSELTGLRELRVHGRKEVVIIKPAARRFWLSAVALDDARAVLMESFTVGNA